MLTTITFFLPPEQQDRLTLSTKGAITTIKPNLQNPCWKGLSLTPDTTLFYAEETQPGFYLTGLNFDNNLKSFGSHVPIDHHWSCFMDEQGAPRTDVGLADFAHGKLDSCYGVADNVQQIEKYFAAAIKGPHPLAISYTPIVREDQPTSGGWRWHKWGPYIGDHKPQFEYLYDEEGIEQVYVFHGYFLQPNPAKLTNAAP